MRTTIGEISGKVGQEVELKGWVHARRDHGKLIFIDLRDRSGLAQVVLTPQIKDASDLRLEYVVEIIGKVKERPVSMVNNDQPNGAYEIEATALRILNKSEPVPFPIDTDGYEQSEVLRMKYRYLDLRRERMRRNLKAKHEASQFIRNYLTEKGFWEVETPILTKSTPEGARDFLVPSRLQKGKFYALPQSPQQYKQMLMVAGVEKYFQIARCFRDEDPRAD